jgi:hypothetical protein
MCFPNSDPKYTICLAAIVGVKVTSMTALLRPIAAFLCLALAPAACISQQPDSSPATVRLEVKDGQSHFLLGDRIVLELVFTNPGSGDYTLNTTIYGDLSEKVTITPAEGWLQWRGPSGHDYSTVTKLESNEIRIPVILNDGFIFRQPGHYQVSVTTSRLQQGKPLASGNQYLTLTTNTVSFDLSERSADEEAALVRTLTNEIASQAGAPTSMNDPRLEAAVRLAGLPGDAAVRAKVSLLLDDSEANQPVRQIIDGGFGGLAASRNLTLQLSLLQAAWNDPQRTPSYELESAISITRHFLHSKTMLPGWQMVVMPPSGKPDAATQQAIDEHNADLDHLIRSLPARTGDNRRDTAYFLIENHNLTPAQLALVKPIAVDEFAHMEPMAQGMLLQGGWKKIGDPALVPAIRAMLDAPPAEFVGYRDALQRLIELDPAVATPYVIREICDPKSGITMESVSALPAETLPSTDACLLQQITQMAGKDMPSGVVAWPEKALIAARFSSAEIYPQMLALYRAHSAWNATIQGDVIAYLLRWHPETASELHLQQHLADSNFMYSFNKAVLARHGTYPESILKTLREELASGDDRDAEHALYLLSQFGTQEDAAIAVARLDRLMQQWAGRTAEWTVHQPTPEAAAAAMLQNELLTRLASANTIWRLPEAERQRIRRLCVGESCKYMGWSDPN